MTSNTTKLALAFLALAAAGATTVYAAEKSGQRHRPALNFEKADADNSGDVTFEEFAAAINARSGIADADGDGKLTVDEIAGEIQRMRDKRMAERIIKRFDTDGDGALTMTEIVSRQKKMFAMLDRNDDGKVTKNEMPRGGKHKFRRN
ncbi:acid-shock protein [Mesorhizobium sp. NBSH29]|uniref:EF-hand domain-containing protein n=1 Tax=Mesorhizobium sp. NBSH29 TaxID=2654249 RepID=UPI00189687FA|nr:EF-hand domain-containing protein [Mesorhizobium sp. NBSH29]QPC87233.1 acid-shock protein [Mesorhizobium sp. NBSH29]